jgi:hypothetical protein
LPENRNGKTKAKKQRPEIITFLRAWKNKNPNFWAEIKWLFTGPSRLRIDIFSTSTLKGQAQARLDFWEIFLRLPQEFEGC